MEETATNPRDNIEGQVLQKQSSHNNGDRDCVEEEKWIKYYSNKHKILLVGEGDFSFALCLAKAFGSASNMVATSLDARESLLRHYSKASQNLEELEERGCNVMHRVDACSIHDHQALHQLLFDRIVFNFPHAGFCYNEMLKEQIQLHQNLVKGFFSSARHMLTEAGEVHVAHKTARPFNEWKVAMLAKSAGLRLVEQSLFFQSDYHGYENKRGSGLNWDGNFPLGSSRTFKFILKKQNLA